MAKNHNHAWEMCSSGISNELIIFRIIILNLEYLKEKIF